MDPGADTERCQNCREIEDRLQKLMLAVEGYLDRPGCNSKTQKTAFEKLRFHLEQARGRA